MSRAFTECIQVDVRYEVRERNLHLQKYLPDMNGLPSFRLFDDRSASKFDGSALSRQQYRKSIDPEREAVIEINKANHVDFGKE